ncbi:hypothetical protein C8R44DRAFT_879571 [Mycena epipterygia]|nr:hypothetical protein C8R44DRAFT_879571 [Mycena epipterygia]
MPPTRTRPHRFSSPTLPPSPLPPSSEPPASDSDDEARITLNRVVCSLRDIANADMLNYNRVLAWVHAKEDYEELYGTFVPDEDAEVVFRRKTSLFNMLVGLRQQLKNWKVATDAAKMTAYFDLEDAFKEEFGSFKAHDGLDHKVQRRLHALQEWDHLMIEAGGDRAMAHTIAARDFSFLAPNPYPAGSDARYAFDTILRQALVAARIDLRTARKFPATVDNPTFLFQLNNPYAAGTNASLNYHCYRRVVRKVMWDKVHAAQCRAGVEPTGHFETPSIAPGVFYGHS